MWGSNSSNITIIQPAMALCHVLMMEKTIHRTIALSECMWYAHLHPFVCNSTHCKCILPSWAPCGFVLWCVDMQLLCFIYRCTPIPRGHLKNTWRGGGYLIVVSRWHGLPRVAVQPGACASRSRVALPMDWRDAGWAGKVGRRLASTRAWAGQPLGRCTTQPWVGCTHYPSSHFHWSVFSLLLT